MLHNYKPPCSYAGTPNFRRECRARRTLHFGDFPCSSIAIHSSPARIFDQRRTNCHTFALVTTRWDHTCLHREA